MIALLQANKNNNEQIEFSEIIFTGEGGQPSMSFSDKNIPPIRSNYIPEELQIKADLNSPQTKCEIYSYKYLNDYTDEIKYPLFRMIIIYEPNSFFVYNPKIAATEKIYTLLYENSAENSNFINVEKINNFYEKVELYDILNIENDIYTITNIIDEVSHLRLEIAPNLKKSYDKNTIVFIENKSFKFDESSLIQKNNNKSPIKAVQIKDFNNKVGINITDYTISTPNTILYEYNDSTIIELYEYYSELQIKNPEKFDSNYALNYDLDEISNTIYLNNINNIQIGDYLTLVDTTDNSYEIVKVVSINTDSSLVVERGKFNTIAKNFNSANTKIYKNASFFFNLYFLPENKDVIQLQNFKILIKYVSMNK